MPRVLLTGSNGFLGSRLSELIEREKSIDLIKSVRKTDSEVSSSIKCDLTNIVEVKNMLDEVKPDIILNAAAFVPKAQSDYESSQSDANVVMVENIIENSDAIFINISSMAVYGVSDRVLHSEDEEARPETAYGKSKNNIENLLRCNISPSLSIRIPGLFGPERKSGLVYNTFKALHFERPPVLPEQPLLWAGMDVRDAADLIVKVMLTWDFSIIDRKCVNISYPGLFSINSFVEIAEKLFDKKISYNIVHPLFGFDLHMLNAVGFMPETDFSSALLRVKYDYGF
ncbi:hypothetical protein ADINL_0229 [Nitrincola lacisaponensis]|uniref:dTDP-4-dehydrorhamnose reductase n=1 Tax=Nitrincola lacisaponensis TaxID=267850 RepID=A0A063Y8U1_9GAMM|nr:NAD(P)-dependent oxidoreductase [Nitrincola lacisaponensis]KDE41156.1 hypothetical protein ADINL_0229 [Nitrincola lacisaponensis]